jgi:hypothetical protein
VSLCAHKCTITATCVAFEVYLGYMPKPACYMFENSLKLPFTANAMCATCVKATLSVLQAKTVQALSSHSERVDQHAASDQHVNGDPGSSIAVAHGDTAGGTRAQGRRSERGGSGDGGAVHSAGGGGRSEHGSGGGGAVASAGGGGGGDSTVRVLASGRLSGGFGLRQWHDLELAISGCTLGARVDSVSVSTVTDAGCLVAGGWGAVGTGWHDAQFKSVSATEKTP